MALSLALSELGAAPSRIDTTAQVTIDKTADGFKITSIELRCEATVPGVDQETFGREAERAKSNCPVSQALGGTDIRLEARLKA